MLITLLQETPQLSGWGLLLEKFGLPIIFLMAVIIFIWKGLWPFMMKLNDNTMAALKEQLQTVNLALMAQRQESIAALEASRKEFLNALEQDHVRFEKATEAMDRATTAMNELTSETRQRRADQREREGGRR